MQKGVVPKTIIFSVITAAALSPALPKSSAGKSSSIEGSLIDIADLRRSVSSRPLRPFEYLEILPKPGAERARREAELTLANGYTLSGDHPPSLKPPVDWNFGKRSSNFHLHAMLPLNAQIAAFDTTNEITFLNAAIAFADDWIEKNMAALRPPFDTNTIEACLAEESGNRWYDMAIGQRLYKLAYLLDAGLRDQEANDAVLQKFTDAIQLHHLLLTDERIYKSQSNHGFYQAINQYAAASRLPELDKHGYAALAQSRLADMIDRQFLADDIHAEHSPGYHHMVTTTLINARNAGMLDDKLANRIARFEANHALFIKPDGGVAPMGDTDPRIFWRQKRYEGFFQDPAMEFIVSGGERGTQPPSGVHELTTSGYAVARLDPVGQDNAAFAAQSYLIQQSAFHSRTHKQADHLGFIWHDNGRDILADPGRYAYAGKLDHESDLAKQGFYYGDPERVYVERTRAHNCIEVDAESYPRRKTKFWGSALVSAELQDELAVFASSATYWRTVRHRRVLAMRPGHFLLVLDWLKDHTQDRDYRQWFCFDPQWEVRRESNIIRGVANGQDRNSDGRLSAFSLIPDSQPEQIAKGQTEPERLGWLSDRANSLVPAASLSISAPKSDIGRFATLFVLSKDVNLNSERTQLNNSLRKGAAFWDDHLGSHRLELSTNEKKLPQLTFESL